MYLLKFFNVFETFFFDVQEEKFSVNVHYCFSVIKKSIWVFAFIELVDSSYFPTFYNLFHEIFQTFICVCIYGFMFF